ncbi:hypothetical protein GGR56DRAFT_674516 [Xylariaceae sp. FL0804]|nr:hypothetical protein GGR56DRAFT_674516 [Xylariaceae sp. FL0804]
MSAPNKNNMQDRSKQPTTPVGGASAMATAPAGSSAATSSPQRPTAQRTYKTTAAAAAAAGTEESKIANPDVAARGGGTPRASPASTMTSSVLGPRPPTRYYHGEPIHYAAPLGPVEWLSYDEMTMQRRLSARDLLDACDTGVRISVQPQHLQQQKQKRQKDEDEDKNKAKLKAKEKEDQEKKKQKTKTKQQDEDKKSEEDQVKRRFTALRGQITGAIADCTLLAAELERSPTPRSVLAAARGGPSEEAEMVEQVRQRLTEAYSMLCQLYYTREGSFLAQ